MIEDKLDKLIELNEKIVNQNEEIINLLKGDDKGEENVVVSPVAEEPEDDDSQIDIYKISVKASDELKVVPQEMEEETRNILDGGNYEITIDNLTGNSLTSQFKMPLLIAVESFNEDMEIPSSVAILDDESYVNIPDILRVAIENGAEKIYLSMKNAMSVLQAPPMIMDYLQFYKNKDDLLKHLK